MRSSEHFCVKLPLKPAEVALEKPCPKQPRPRGPGAEGHRGWGGHEFAHPSFRFLIANEVHNQFQAGRAGSSFSRFLFAPSEAALDADAAHALPPTS